jgi:hypothetical protein
MLKYLPPLPSAQGNWSLIRYRVPPASAKVGRRPVIGPWKSVKRTPLDPFERHVGPELKLLNDLLAREFGVPSAHLADADSGGCPVANLPRTFLDQKEQDQANLKKRSQPIGLRSRHGQDA